MTDKNLYNEKSIESLSPLEFCRLRPQVYAGSTEYSTQLLVEIFSNAVDEFRVGHGSEIDVRIDKDVVSVQDEGQGFLVNSIREEDGKTILEAAFSVLNTSGKYRDDGSYEGTSLGSFGIGSKITTFLSHWLHVETYRDGKSETIDFKEGVFDKRTLGTSKEHGTFVRWKPSEQFFTNTEVELTKVRTLFKTVACLCPGLTINLTANGKVEKFNSTNGLNDLVDEATKNKEIIRNRLNVRYSQDKYKLDLVLTYTDSNSATIVPYVNTGVTDSGPHITQIKTTVTREMNKFFKSRGWLKDKDSNLSGDEVQDGIYILFNITAPDVKYDAQVKSRVTQINMTPLNAALSDSLQDWLELNEIEIKKIFDKATLAKKAKEAAKKAKDKILKPKDTTKKSLKEKLAMSDKFIDCSSKNPNERELIIVEGVGAASSCLEARNAKTQAIMLLRGKVINVLKSPIERVLANQEYHDIVESIGAGIGNTFDINKCKFDKILIATDADPDGDNIAALLLTFFWTYMRPLLLSGKVYRVLTPLYTATYKGERSFLYNEDDLAAYRKGKDESKIKLTHAKGLGENSAQELKEYCFDAQNYQRIIVPDEQSAGDLFEQLMGKNVEARKDFLYENANFMEEM